MEWVETTARTLDEAKDLALDRLGVAEDDAEFEILGEPKPGLFGRLRGEARVRARVRPAQARQKVERRDRRPRKTEGGDAAPTTPKSRQAHRRSPVASRHRSRPGADSGQAVHSGSRRLTAKTEDSNPAN